MYTDMEKVSETDLVRDAPPTHLWIYMSVYIYIDMDINMYAYMYRIGVRGGRGKCNARWPFWTFIHICEWLHTYNFM